MKANERDRDIGERLAAIRRAKSLSQSSLAAATGITKQQIQKYESGRNQIPVARLHQLARPLGVSVPDIVDPAGSAGGLSEEVLALMQVGGAHELGAAYAAIRDPQFRREILAVVRSFARLQSAS
ncbi:helix-turn-helix domain-containing protein [Methylobacterium nigriterrae]|uniref:helix-turn-helix domain-containing protein n=1 Tax=Methylobacterium nigriterrae TaxID=3127512 RepID=UPI00301401FA